MEIIWYLDTVQHNLFLLMLAKNIRSASLEITEQTATIHLENIAIDE
jgi:hypothetical protein